MNILNTSLILLVVLIIGCGGDGSSCAGSTDGLTGGSGANPSATIRQNVGGDEFHYSVSGSYSQVGGVQNGQLAGTAVEDFGATTQSGQPVTSDVLAITVPLQSGTVTQTSQRQRNSIGTIVAETDANELQLVTSGQITIPASFSTSVSLSGTEGLANGTTITESFQVVDVATIDCPAGTFDCWKVLEVMTFSDGLVVKKTIFLSPDLGAPAEEVLELKFPSGLSENLTLLLKSDKLG